MFVSALSYYSAFTETGVTRIMKTNQRAEPKQYIPTFSDPANQMSMQNNEIASFSVTGDAHGTMESIGFHYLGVPGFSERTVNQRGHLSCYLLRRVSCA